MTINFEGNKQMKFYNMTADQALSEVGSRKHGLSKEEAEERLISGGANVLKEKNKNSPIKIFFRQFTNMMTLLLILVGIVSLVFALTSSENHDTLIDSFVIFGCVLVNSIMGFVQEMKSENAIESLKDITSSKTQVKRGGSWIEIDSSKLVVGDIILLDSGDKVPADARIISCANAKVDESVLTGESLSVEKEDCVLDGDVLIQDCKNMIFSGTAVVAGRIEAVIVKTGMDTELGKIAGSLDKPDETLTPLQVKIKKVSGFIMILASILVAMTLCYGLIMKKDALTIIMLCISMVLASVPEVLPVSITATLNIGVQQMGKKKAIVKQLAAVETLGATQIICSDKTGTITTNQMTLIEIYANEKTYLNVKNNRNDLDDLNHVMALCNDNEEDAEHKGEFIGDPVEVALSKYIYNLNLNLDIYRNEHKRVGEIPFDSNRKMMSTINEFGDKLIMQTKGSLGEIIGRCTNYQKNGKVYKINKIIANKYLAKEKAMSKKAYKVLAIASKEIEYKSKYDEEDERGLTLLGIVGLVDPPKDGVKEAVRICKEAKIRPIMITGDSLSTAMAVAIDVGIAKDNSQGVEGKIIDALTDDELVSFVKKYSVYARVTPEHKVRIVRAFQAAGKVVAMTGDGVNDAPALKLAHVGVGMGRSGTDVTKNVADILLMDDSFSTIVTAVDEGRRIYGNVLRTILYNLSSNFTEIFLIIMGMILMKDLISPIHILYIDIIADTLPSIALAFEGSDRNSMKRSPVGLNRKIFTPFMMGQIIMSSLIEAGLSIAIFFVSRNMFGYEMAQTLTLLSIILQEFTFTYNCKELKDFSFKKGFFSNKVLNIITLALILVQIPVFFTPIGSIFGLCQINIWQFLSIFGVTIVGFLMIEFLKPLFSHGLKDR